MSEDLHRKGGACVNDEEIIKLFEARDEKGISAAGERYGKLLRSVALSLIHI